MAITASGLYVQNMGIDVFDATQLAINLALASHKLAGLSDTATPNFDTDVTWTNANEVTGTGWVTGGIALSAAAAGATSTSPTLTISPAGTAMYDMNDVSVANTTITNMMAVREYADALLDELILLIDFVTAVSTNAGTLGIQWAAAGVFTLDLTP